MLTRSFEKKGTKIEYAIETPIGWYKMKSKCIINRLKQKFLDVGKRSQIARWSRTLNR